MIPYRYWQITVTSKVKFSAIWRGHLVNFAVDHKLGHRVEHAFADDAIDSLLQGSWLGGASALWNT